MRAFENRIAALDGGIDAVAVGSGMAAVSYALLSVAEGGGRIIAPTNLYGASIDAFQSIFPKFGIHVDFVDDINDFEAVKAAIKTDTKAVFVESVANPSTDIADIEQLATIAHQAGIPLIVDNTFPTPYLLRPFDFGADIDVYSSTKAINGMVTSCRGSSLIMVNLTGTMAGFRNLLKMNLRWKRRLANQ